MRNMTLGVDVLPCDQKTGACLCKPNVEVGFLINTAWPKGRLISTFQCMRRVSMSHAFQFVKMSFSFQQGMKCDQCRQGSFGLDPDYPLGCYACFCFPSSSQAACTQLIGYRSVSGSEHKLQVRQFLASSPLFRLPNLHLLALINQE